MAARLCGDRPAGPGAGGAPRAGGRPSGGLSPEEDSDEPSDCRAGRLGCPSERSAVGRSIREREGRAAALEGWSVTAWGERYEVFAETGPLVAGASVTSNAHVTVLSGFAPLKDGAVTLVLRGSGGAEEVFRQEQPKRDGIYPIEVKPRAEGTFDLRVPDRVVGGHRGSRRGPREGRLGGVARRPRRDRRAGGPRRRVVPQGAAVADRVRDRLGPRGRARRKRRRAGAGEAGREVARPCSRQAWTRPWRLHPGPTPGSTSSEAGRCSGSCLVSAIGAFRSCTRTRRLSRPRPTSRAGAWSVSTELLARRGHQPGGGGEGARDAREPGSAARVRARRGGLGDQRRPRKDAAAAIPVRAPWAGRVAEVVGLPGPDRRRGRCRWDAWCGSGRCGSSWRFGRRRRPASRRRRRASSSSGPASRRRWRSRAKDVQLVSRSPEVDPRTASVSVILEVDRSASELPLGSAVEAEIVLAGERRGIVVPLSALARRLRHHRRLRAAGRRELRAARGARAARGSGRGARGRAPVRRAAGDAGRRRGAAQLLLSAGAPEGHVH